MLICLYLDHPENYEWTMIEYFIGNRVLKCWSVGGPRVGSVMVLVLERLFSAMCPKMQKKLLFGKRKVLPPCHLQYNDY